MTFRWSVIIAELWRPEVARRWKNRFWVFLKTTHFEKIFKIATPIEVLCSNFVKFGRREIGEMVSCLYDKQTKIRLAPQISLLCGSRPKCARASPNVLIVLQISSKSVHFRRSYVWTREHRQSARSKVNPIFGWSLASSRIKPNNKPCD